MKVRRLSIVFALVVVCAAGCAAFSNNAAPLPAVTSISGDVSDRVSYTGIHWLATQVWREGVTQPAPAAMAVTVDFLESGSVIFSDGVNVVDARWAPLAAGSVRLQAVSSSAAGYVGQDAGQLAAILAVEQLTSPAGAGHPAMSDIIVSRTGDRLTLTGTGVRISYLNAGPTAPGLTQSVPASTSSSTWPPPASAPTGGDTPTRFRTTC